MGRSRRTPTPSPSDDAAGDSPIVQIDVGDGAGLRVQVLQRLASGWLLRLDDEGQRRLSLLGSVKLQVRAAGQHEMLTAKTRVVRVIDHEVAQSRGMVAGVHVELLRHDPVIDAHLARASELLEPQKDKEERPRRQPRAEPTRAQTPAADQPPAPRSPAPRSPAPRSPTPRPSASRPPTPRPSASRPSASRPPTPRPSASRPSASQSPSRTTPSSRSTRDKRRGAAVKKRKPDALSVEASAMAVKLRGELRRLTKVAAADRLGIDRDASPREVRRGFVRAARRFHPDNYHRYGREDIVHLAEEIYLLLSEAEQRLLRRQPSTAPTGTPAPSANSHPRQPRQRRRDRK